MNERTIHQMDTQIFDNRYFKSSQWFLRAMGLWPYQSKFQKLTRCIYYYFISLSVVIPQVNFFFHKKIMTLIILSFC